MKRRFQVAIVAVVAFLLFFFFVPVFYWATVQYVNTQTLQEVGSSTEYRSLGCMTIGFGTTYFDGSYWSEGYGGGAATNGFQFSCWGPLPPYHP
jgi:hypothetical protein